MRWWWEDTVLALGTSRARRDSGVSGLMIDISLGHTHIPTRRSTSDLKQIFESEQQIAICLHYKYIDLSLISLLSLPEGSTSQPSRLCTRGACPAPPDVHPVVAVSEALDDSVISEAFAGLRSALCEQFRGDVDVFRGAKGIFELLLRGFTEVTLFTL